MSTPSGLGVDELLRALGGSFRLPGPSRDLDGYIEAQIHGGVSLADDAVSVVLDPSFHGTHVDHDLTAAAGRYGFEPLDCEAVPSDFRGPTMPSARKALRAVGRRGRRTCHRGCCRVHRLRRTPVGG